MTSSLIEMVVDAVSNDYESYDMIINEATQWANDENIDCSRTSINNALWDAMEDGFVDAFSYSEHDGKFKRIKPSEEEVENSYFYATDNPRKAYFSDCRASISNAHCAV